MPVTYTSVVRPAGRLDPGVLGDDCTELITGWVAEAVGKSADEAAQTSWVNYRYFQFQLDDMMNDPAIQRDGDTSSAFLNAQFGQLRSERDAARDAFNAIVTPSLSRVSKQRTMVEVF